MGKFEVISVNGIFINLEVNFDLILIWLMSKQLWLFIMKCNEMRILWCIKLGKIWISSNLVRDGEIIWFGISSLVFKFHAQWNQQEVSEQKTWIMRFSDVFMTNQWNFLLFFSRVFCPFSSCFDSFYWRLKWIINKSFFNLKFLWTAHKICYRLKICTTIWLVESSKNYKWLEKMSMKL